MCHGLELRCFYQPYMDVLSLPAIEVPRDLSILRTHTNHEWNLSYQSIFLRRLS